ncbi:MAG TPA: HAMP domain-containing sensor histidine kinase, partial [Candidatus Xenobia bacterium]
LPDLETTVNKVLGVVSRLKAARQADLSKAQAEAASAAKSQFLADISHELRTPLHAIIMYSELILEEHRNDTDLQRDASQIRIAGRHLMTLINDLLDYSKLEAGRLVLKPEVFSVAKLVSELAGLMKTALAGRGNLLQVAVGDGVTDMNADLTRVRQCLLNLLSNACKFTEKGLITVQVVIEGEALVFSVTDTGIGMTREQCGRIFARWEQADHTTAKSYGGSGLGLAITSQLVELMGGRMGVESSPGQGSVFTIRLPVEVPEKVG